MEKGKNKKMKKEQVVFLLRSKKVSKITTATIFLLAAIAVVTIVIQFGK